MKIAITSQGKDLSSPLDPRLGRANGFIVYDLDSGEFTYKDNQHNMNAPQGAGAQAAQDIADLGVKAVITGHAGPRAFSALGRGGIEIYLFNGQTVQEAITAFQNGELSSAAGADKPGHW